MTTVGVARLERVNVALIIENVMIWRHETGNDGFAKPTRRVNHDRVAVAADRVSGEHHARDLSVDHVLHDDGDLDIFWADTNLAAVCDSAFSPQGRPAPLYRIDQLRCAGDIEVGVLLTGKSGPWQVLGGRAGAHCYWAGCHVRVSVGDLGAELGGHRGVRDVFVDQST